MAPPPKALQGHVARKRFGQHFLTDRSVIAAIAAAIAPREGDRIVEIGPGLGALTDELLGRTSRIAAVELDRDLAQRLRRRYPPERLELHEGDALAFDFASLAPGGGASQGPEGGPRRAPLRLVGNLPYNISSPLLVRLLDFRRLVADQHFMLQKEVVDRIVAAPRTPDYGRLSVLMQAFYDVESLFVVPPQAFDPPPRVDSAVMRMIVREAPPLDDPVPLQEVLAAAFAQRRKMLRGTLIPWLAARGVEAAGIDPEARAEEIDVQTWCALAARLKEKTKE